MILSQRYNYRAKIVRVVDGDTVELDIDIGFKLTYRTMCRLYGINAPEMKGETKEKALQAREYLRSLVPASTVVDVKTHKDKDKFGRYLASIFIDGMDVNQSMVSSGHAVKFMEEK